MLKILHVNLRNWHLSLSVFFCHFCACLHLKKCRPATFSNLLLHHWSLHPFVFDWRIDSPIFSLSGHVLSRNLTENDMKMKCSTSSVLFPLSVFVLSFASSLCHQLADTLKSFLIDHNVRNFTIYPSSHNDPSVYFSLIDFSIQNLRFSGLTTNEKNAACCTGARRWLLFVGFCWGAGLPRMKKTGLSVTFKGFFLGPKSEAVSILNGLFPEFNSI